MHPFVKFVPSLLLCAICGYLAWGFCEDAPPAAPAANLPAVGAEYLHPAQPPQVGADPFGDTVRFELGEFVDIARKGRPVPHPPGGDKKTPTTAGNPKSNSHTTTAGAKSGGPQSSKTSTPGTKPSGPHSTNVAGARPGATTGPAGTKTTTGAKSAAAPLVLNATLLYGNSRLALINGKVYRPGDRLDNGGDGSGDGEALRVADVSHDRVLLERDGRQTELTYSNESTAGPAPKRGGPAAKSALAGAKQPPPKPAASALAKTQPSR